MFCGERDLRAGRSEGNLVLHVHPKLSRKGVNLQCIVSSKEGKEALSMNRRLTARGGRGGYSTVVVLVDKAYEVEQTAGVSVFIVWNVS